MQGSITTTNLLSAFIIYGSRVAVYDHGIEITGPLAAALLTVVMKRNITCTYRIIRFSRTQNRHLESKSGYFTFTEYFSTMERLVFFWFLYSIATTSAFIIHVYV